MNINLQKLTATVLAILFYTLILLGTIYATGVLESHAAYAFIIPFSFQFIGFIVTLKSIWRAH